MEFSESESESASESESEDDDQNGKRLQTRRPTGLPGSQGSQNPNIPKPVESNPPGAGPWGNAGVPTPPTQNPVGHGQGPAG
ncbi:uncharacterized protein PG998_010573 [Apiospora kogelbergensis]|uniref:uncharacterized protein n=1 Tax=Apiospora kogelbergensis TaxID=1337665 RepID=UPI0031322DCB